MPRPIPRFVEAPSGYETSHAQIVYENYGVTMYYAQLIEDKLRVIMAGLEVLGLVHIDREAYKLKEASDGIIEACIGQMLYILREHSRFDIPRDFIRHLTKANMQRNMLAHRFFLLYARDSSQNQVACVLPRSFFQYTSTLSESTPCSMTCNVRYFGSVAVRQRRWTKRRNNCCAIFGKVRTMKRPNQPLELTATRGAVHVLRCLKQF